MKVGELAPYVGTGQGWDFQYESVLAAFVWLHGGFGSCCSLCNRGKDADYSQTPVERARKLLIGPFDPNKPYGTDEERHAEDVAIAVLIDELVAEQNDAQDCCGSEADEYPAHKAYAYLRADLEKTARDIAKQGPESWRHAGHPLPADMEAKFA